MLQAVEQTLASGRSSLNEAEFVRVRDYLRADPDDGPALFAAKGTDVIDSPAAAARYRARCFNSFSSDTFVVLSDGSRVRIADLDPGDRVLTFNVDTGLTSSGVVTASLSHAAPFGELELSDGSSISVTADHVVFDASSASWVQVEDLPDGAVMANSNGGVSGVDGYTASSAHGVVWDITVAGAHNYYVSASETSDAVLVHNADELCSERLTLDQFDELSQFVDGSPASSAGLSVVFADSLRLAQKNGLSQGEYESMLERLARLASEEPDVLEELSLRPSWLLAAFDSTPAKFDVLLDAATSNTLLRGASQDAIESLGKLSNTQLNEAVGILNGLDPQVTPKSLFDAVVTQSGARAGDQLDVIGGIRQLKPGEQPRLIVEDGSIKALDITGTPLLVKQQPAAPGGSFVLDSGVEIQVKSNGFVRFPETSAGRRIKFSTVQIDQSAIANTGKDFGAANRVMKARIEAFESGQLTDPVELAEIEAMPEQLRRWFADSPAKQGSPGLSDNPLLNAGADYTWHHSEVTGQLELVERATHQAVQHLGGARLWGDTLAKNARDGKLGPQ